MLYVTLIKIGQYGKQKSIMTKCMRVKFKMKDCEEVAEVADPNNVSNVFVYTENLLYIIYDEVITETE